MELKVKTKSMEVEEDGIVTVAVNSIGVLDHQNDISESGSFDKTLKENFQNIRHYLNHDSNKLVGCPIEGKEENGSLVFKSALCLDTELGRDTYALYKLYRKHGNTLQHSIGVSAVKRDESDRRKVKEWKMFEFSTLTKVGACPGTHLIDIKSLQEDPEATITMLKDALGSTFSDNSKVVIENQMKLIEKAKEGKARLVTCKDCGLVFDFDSLKQHSIEDEIVESYRNRLRWMADEIVSQQVREMRPEVEREVADLISRQKSLSELGKWVRCPKCYGKIYESEIINIGSQPTTVTVVEQKAAQSTFLSDTAKIITNKYKNK